MFSFEYSKFLEQFLYRTSLVAAPQKGFRSTDGSNKANCLYKGSDKETLYQFTLLNQNSNCVARSTMLSNTERKTGDKMAFVSKCLYELSFTYLDWFVQPVIVD